MPSLKTPVYFLEALILDALSFPGRLMTKEENALWHLKYVCSKCSKWRKSFRDPLRTGDRCLWKEQWIQGNYSFPRDFGFFNWARYYLGLRTELTKYINKVNCDENGRNSF